MIFLTPRPSISVGGFLLVAAAGVHRTAGTDWLLRFVIPTNVGIQCAAGNPLAQPMDKICHCVAIDSRLRGNDTKKGGKMFKLFNITLIALALVLHTNAVRADRCPAGTYTESVDLGFDPDVEPTNYTYNAANMTWEVTAPYGTLSGIAVCNSTAGSYAVATSTDFPTGTSGVYCWCKMTSPATSAWVYFIGHSSASDCDSLCAFRCGYRGRDSSDFRRGVFGSAYQCVAIDDNCPTGTHFLDPDIEPTNYTYSTANMTWEATTSYGNVSGIASCNSTSGLWAWAYPQYDFNQSSTGLYCWCKMTSPATSAWVYRDDHSYASDCDSNCARFCGNYVRDYSDFRGGVIGSADNQCIANTININWENATGGTHASNSCTYGGALSTPATAPTKRGYVFTGWAFE